MIILEEEEIVLQIEEAFLESDVPYYEGEYTVTPTGEAQTLPTGGMRLEEDIVVEPVPGGELATPSIDVSSSGLITAQAGVSESGYIADTDTKSATQQLSTQAGKTVTPTESEQTAVDEHKYTTGKVKVAAVPSDYVGSGIARKDSSSLSASGKRVTAPAGYYAEAAGKDVAGGSATTPATEITANPSISVDANGLITAGVSKTQSITPTVVEGYVENGTAGNVSVSGSATSQLPTDNGSEVTPSTQEQTLNLSGKFMKGNVKVKKIPSEYVVPSGTKEITKSANGTTTENVSGYAEAEITVNVPASAVDTGTKTIAANGNGQDVVGYAAVNVNVPNSYSASDEGKVVQSGALVSQSSQTVTENGTYDTTLKNQVTVAVPSVSMELLADYTSTEAATIVEVTIPTGKQNYEYYKIEIDAEFSASEFPYFGVNGAYSSYALAKQQNTPYVFVGAVVMVETMKNGNTDNSFLLAAFEKYFANTYPLQTVSIKSYYENKIKAGCRIRVWGLPT